MFAFPLDIGTPVRIGCAREGDKHMISSGERLSVRRGSVFVRRRFCVVVLIGVGLISLHSAIAHAHGVSPAEMTVVVRAGDTLWGLGERYAPPTVDLRHWVYATERLNELRSSLLIPGETLRLPR